MNPTILGTALALALAMPIGAARAQAPPAAAPAAPSFDEVQATIKRMQERLNRLGTAAAERDQALRFLEQQVDQASGEIAGTGKTNESLARRGGGAVRPARGSEPPPRSAAGRGGRARCGAGKPEVEGRHPFR